MARLFGDVPGVQNGDLFPSRAAASQAGVHRPTMAGISGGQAEGADSIVVSGGYEDDRDFGDEIIYTGHGGNDPASGRQVADQRLEAGNLALAVSADRGLPVRVLRGAGGDPQYSPPSGFRYDGLFYVDRYWSDVGKSGYRIWRYRLARSPRQNDVTNPPPGRSGQQRYATTQRLVRNTAVTQWVKELHEYRCQVCGRRLETPSGAYAEGAHLRPVGRPHNGPDSPENVLCLCPNDHVRLDRGVIGVDSAQRVIELGTGRPLGKLRTMPRHQVADAHAAYHRALFL
jgi:putative restriction endonuclease